jgi:hypothetical protein
MRIIFLTIIVLLIIIKPTCAGIFIEPYTGYSSGSGKTSLSNQTEHTHEYLGHLMGIKLGFHRPQDRVFWGLNSTLDNILLDSELNGELTRDRARKIHHTFIMGTTFSSLRLWAGYTFAGNIKGVKEDDQPNRFITTDKNFFNAKGYHLGLAYFITPNIALNATYNLYNYNDLMNSGVKADNLTESSFSNFQIYLSFPFGFSSI